MINKGTFDEDRAFGLESVKDVFVDFKDMEVIITFDERFGKMDRSGFAK